MSDGGFKSSFICRYKMVAVCIMDCSVFALDIISCPFVSIVLLALALLAIYESIFLSDTHDIE